MTLGLMITDTYTSVRRCCTLMHQYITLTYPAGYYVHTCPKMLYKGEYSPSYLLDPVRPTSSLFALW
jgi:arginyl-tRNA--protein-N-Asp/Glu arginylyltransferase